MGTNRRRYLAPAGGGHYVAGRSNTTPRKGIQPASSQFSARLLKLQDEERRRIGRELHDSTGQLLALLKLNIDKLGKVPTLNWEQKRLVADNAAMLQSLAHELGTISHLLHPPLLDEVGLSSALQWYVDGFAQRSGIATTLDLDPGFGRLYSDAEIAIFRIVQECLTNVHRHSGSRKAVVRLQRFAGEVRLEVQDQGKGIPEEKHMHVLKFSPLGIGLRGMRERVRQLGGKLEIRSGHGTTVIAILPIAAASSMAA